ncbi:MarR family winged helix-turn-helix transcriptional regulator [Aureimonas populi]|uniref:MarR family winged helix-turn-helix transcriptional regulator n=1 Tax=Aureimonas populi TaxID=1701758 RepID=A0ABW5CLS3_9HYPH|nr:MarR family transcriptional regulator [Aureimonas populi]
MKTSNHGAVGAWAKRCYFAGRAMMETTLRPYGLGATQWYVLYQLAHDGPTMQRDLLRTLEVERATLSAIIGALVRKGLVEQIPDRVDQRQKLLRMTPAGASLWQELPDLATLIHDAAFAGIDNADIATAVRVLRVATERLNKHSEKETKE